MKGLTYIYISFLSLIDKDEMHTKRRQTPEIVAAAALQQIATAVLFSRKRELVDEFVCIEKRITRKTM